MGRGALSKVRWKNDRIRKKKARDKRGGRPADGTATATAGTAAGAGNGASSESSS